MVVVHGKGIDGCQNSKYEGVKLVVPVNTIWFEKGEKEYCKYADQLLPDVLSEPVWCDRVKDVEQ